MSAPNVDYYKILEIESSANAQQIRDAYKKAALKHHPDRVPSNSPERPRRTRLFQQINDAYYTLSDPTRRREYDATRRFQSFTSSSSNTNYGQDGGFDYDEEVPQPNDGSQANGGNTWGGFFQNFPWSAFGSSSSNKNDPKGAKGTQPGDENFSSKQFGSVFEEMMREQGMADGSDGDKPTGKFWSLVGGASGGAMGFIVANVPGAVAGAVAGNRLGAVRDAKGKSVYSVFQELPQADRGRLLTELAAKVFAHAVSG